MNLSTIIVGALVFGVFAVIVGRGMYNMRHHKCSCGCSGCPNSQNCHHS